VPPRFSGKKVPSYNFVKAVEGNIAALIVGVKYFIKPIRFTLMYPSEYIKLDSRYRGFIVLNKAKCIGCESCARICPAAAMKMIKIEEQPKQEAQEHSKKPVKKVKKHPVINYQRCIFCGFCVDVCPVEALRHIPVHDVVYLNMAEMDLDLIEFQKEPVNPAAAEGGIPVRYVFDPDRGLIKVRAEGQESAGGERGSG